MSFLLEKYRAFAPKEQKQIVLLIIFCLLSAYLFYAAKTWEAMFETQKLANRKADRIEKRIGDFKPPTLAEGVSEQVLNKLQSTQLAQESELKAFAKMLLPLGDSAAREELKLALTQLAYSNQLRLASLKTKELKVSDELTSLTGAELREYLQSRPTFKLILSGQFLNLVRFVESLNQLNYQVYVSNLDLGLINDSSSLLKIELELRI